MGLIHSGQNHETPRKISNNAVKIEQCAINLSGGSYATDIGISYEETYEMGPQSFSIVQLWPSDYQT